MARICKVMPVLMLAAGACWAQASAQRGLAGSLKSSDGKPLEGVTVSARMAGRTFTTSVYTDKEGKYSFPTLDQGAYQLWAQAVSFETVRSDANVSSGKAGRWDATLKPLKDYSLQLSGEEWLASLPEGNFKERREKALFVNNCTACHQSGFPLQNKFDTAGWTAIVDLMSRTGGLGGYQGNRVGFPIIQQYKEELVSFLTRVRGPNSPPLQYKLAPRPTGEATRAVVTEFDLPPGEGPNYFSTHNGSDWSLGTPSAYEGRSPHDLAIDSKGNAWFTDQASPDRTLGKVDAKTGKITGWKLPSFGASAGAVGEDNLRMQSSGAGGTTVGSHGISFDAAGDLWITNSSDGELTKFDPRTEKFVRFPRPAGMTPISATYVSVDSKANVWGVTKAGVLRLNPKTGEYTEFKSVTPGGDHYGMTVDSQDNAWFTQMGKDRLGFVDGKSGSVSEVVFAPSEMDVTPKDLEVAVKFAANNISSPPQIKGPRRMGADPTDGNVWVALYFADRLAKVDIRTKKITEYPMPRPYMQPYAVAVDKNHMVWICTFTDRVLRFDPRTEKYTEYVLPTRGTEMRYITVDDTTSTPTVWVAYWRANKVARLEFPAQ